MPNLLDLARAISAELIAWRRDFHMHPEVSWEETRTAGIVADLCAQWGLEVRRNVAGTGVVAVLNSEARGPAIALRADMDALPIQEENQTPYKSQSPGKGHLCGHDAHTAMLLGAAKLLARFKDRIPFPVHFIFQPAEEVPRGGAEAMVAAGVLDGIDAIYGLHVLPLLPTGTLGLRVGSTMASMSKFEIELEGVGGHGAIPHLAQDPIPATAELIMALQTIVSRRVDPMDAAVVSVCQMQAGSAFNAIPSRAWLCGTVRSLSPRVGNRLPEWIDEIAQSVAKAHRLSAKVSYVTGTPVLVNGAEGIERLRRAFVKLGGTDRPIDATMGGEDFAFFLQRVPGAFAFLGAGDGSNLTGKPFHHPRYDIDERALPWGAGVLAQLVLDQAGLNK